MFAGLLPHDGSAGGGGTARHGCCKEAKREETWERGEINLGKKDRTETGVHKTVPVFQYP